MDLHPIPRQITTFEFKLIGFMTVKQFGYVLLAGVFGYLFFLAIPIQILNIIVGVLVLSVGLVFAFVPINDRPLEVFVRNLIKRLNSPTQHVFQKHNTALKIFDELYFEDNPHIILAHADSREKLMAYMNLKAGEKSEQKTNENHNAHIQTLLKEKQLIVPLSQNRKTATEQTFVAKSASVAKIVTTKQSPTTKHPVFTGVVYNKRHIPLPGVLLYIRDPKTNNVLRILKTNPHGVFATFNPLQDGDYSVEILDSTGGYLFDKTTITVNNQTRPNFEFVSKESV